MTSLPSRDEPGSHRLAKALIAMICVAGAFGTWLVSNVASTPAARARAERTTPLNAGISYGDELSFMTPGDLDAALDDATSVGARWIRADLSWQDVQPVSSRRFDWSGFDRIVKAASARGLDVLPVLAYTPVWAREPGCGSSACAPAHPEAFAHFAALAAARYSARGVHSWEIWNEPNVTAFWQPTPNVPAYARLLRLTAEAVRAHDTSAFVISGGLADAKTRDGNISQTAFLTRLSALGGNRLVDAIGYHPYTYPFLPSVTTPWHTPWDRIDRAPGSLRRILVRFGTPDLPFWLTEFGAPTGGPGTASDGSQLASTTHVTEERQSQIIVDGVETAWADDGIAALFVYDDKDRSTDPSTNENFYGLRRSDGTEKPAFFALSEVLHRLVPLTPATSMQPQRARPPRPTTSSG